MASMGRGRVMCAIALVMLLVAAVSLPRHASAGLMSSWDASSGLLPDQITPPWTLIDEATPENPVLAGGILTLSGSGNTERMYYIQSGSTVDTSGPFFVEARIRFVSGSSTSIRAPIGFAITTAPGLGQLLWIGRDEVFFIAGNVRGPSTSVDTDGSFHTYRIEVSDLGALSLFYDGGASPVLTAQTYNDIVNHGTVQRVAWGEFSVGVAGTSEWSFVRHDALAASVPLPASLVMFLSGLPFLAVAGRGRPALKV